MRISGQDVIVRAAIRRIDSYSAHADQGELAEWIGQRAPVAGSLFLIHGEQAALEALRQLAQARLEGTQIVLPEIGESYELPPAAPARRIRTGRTDLRQALGRDWQTASAQLATSLKHDLAEIKDAQQREAAIAAMRKVLDSYTRFREDKRGKDRRR